MIFYANPMARSNTVWRESGLLWLFFLLITNVMVRWWTLRSTNLLVHQWLQTMLSEAGGQTWVTFPEWLLALTHRTTDKHTYRHRPTDRHTYLQTHRPADVQTALSYPHTLIQRSPPSESGLHGSLMEWCDFGNLSMAHKLLSEIQPCFFALQMPQGTLCGIWREHTNST